MRSFYLALALLLVFGPSKLSSQESSKPDQAPWTWFGNCSNASYMAIEVWMNGTAIYKTSVPICQIKDVSEEDPHHKILVFFFKGGYTFQDEYHTKPTQKIEGNIWQAGADYGGILFGISFSASGRHGQILLNTIHIANHNKESRTEIDRELIVHTFPIADKNNHNN